MSVLAKTSCKEINVIIKNLYENGIIKDCVVSGRHLKLHLCESNRYITMPATPSCRRGRVLENTITSIKRCLRESGIDITSDIVKCFKHN